ncbi:uncharacterized protein [Venturia canescens]|uniref:uncharacterized protein n=1 Tax=Venturia canescens TaxID=32260 RepID=UPI001C9BFA9A|nr:uncharacterized protein LOC122406044 [Venturia canescens]
MSIGPYQLPQTLTTATYTRFLRTKLRRLCLHSGMALEEFDNAWFQQDGAPAHTSAAARKEPAHLFEERVIERGGRQDWPPFVGVLLRYLEEDRVPNYFRRFSETYFSGGDQILE